MSHKSDRLSKRSRVIVGLLFLAPILILAPTIMSGSTDKDTEGLLLWGGIFFLVSLILFFPKTVHKIINPGLIGKISKKLNIQDNKNDQLIKKESYSDIGSFYLIISYFVGFVGFLGIWVYSIISWGLLLGLMIGWIPAMIGGVIIGLLWPLCVIFIIFILLIILQ